MTACSAMSCRSRRLGAKYRPRAKLVAATWSRSVYAHLRGISAVGTMSPDGSATRGGRHGLPAFNGSPAPGCLQPRSPAAPVPARRITDQAATVCITSSLPASDELMRLHDRRGLQSFRDAHGALHCSGQTAIAAARRPPRALPRLATRRHCRQHPRVSSSSARSPPTWCSTLTNVVLVISLWTAEGCEMVGGVDVRRPQEH